ncbi:hypothetical protein [Streptomyces crystallinus]
MPDCRAGGDRVLASDDVNRLQRLDAAAALGVGWRPLRPTGDP